MLSKVLGKIRVWYDSISWMVMTRTSPLPPTFNNFEKTSHNFSAWASRLHWLSVFPPLPGSVFFICDLLGLWGNILSPPIHWLLFFSFKSYVSLIGLRLNSVEEIIDSWSGGRISRKLSKFIVKVTKSEWSIYLIWFILWSQSSPHF